MLLKILETKCITANGLVAMGGNESFTNTQLPISLCTLGSMDHLKNEWAL